MKRDRFDRRWDKIDRQIKERKRKLEEMKENRDIKGLIKLLKHRDSFMQMDAAYALGEIGDTIAVEPLPTLKSRLFNFLMNCMEESLSQLIETIVGFSLLVYIYFSSSMELVSRFRILLISDQKKKFVPDLKS